MGEQVIPTGSNRSTWKQILLAFLANFSTIAPSMSIGFSAIAISVLQKELSITQITWFASIASLATPFGCFFSGPVADRFGRKPALLLVNVVCFLGWMIITAACSTNGSNFPLLMVGRTLTGLSTGLCSSPATIYMAEVASPALRGVFTVWASIFFCLGVLAIYFLGFVLKENLAMISFVAALLPSMGFGFTMRLIPESPSWLIGKNRIDEARSNMNRIFGSVNNTHQVESEIDVLLRSSGNRNKSKKSLGQQLVSKFKFLLQPYCIRPLMLVLIYFFFQQFSGVFVILFFAIEIVRRAGITFDFHITILIIALVRIVATILASVASKRFGRRPLTLISGTCMSACLLGLVGFLHLKENGTIVDQSMNLVPFILLMVYFFTSSIGFLPVPFALAAELFPTKIKGLASGLSSGIGYFFNFVTVKTYRTMVDQFGSKGMFGFYGLIALVGTIYLAWFLPETKGKTMEEIQIYYGKREEEENRNPQEEK